MEIEKLKQIIKEKDVIIENNEERIRELEIQVTDFNISEDSVREEINPNEISDIMNKYENLISDALTEREMLRQEKDTVQNHLANLEVAFHDLVEKYERAKTIIHGYEQNEAALLKHIDDFEKNIQRLETKYIDFKTYAIEKLTEANAELERKEKEHMGECVQLKTELAHCQNKMKSLENDMSRLVIIPKKTNEPLSIFKPLINNFK